MTEPVYLFDISAYLHRALYAVYPSDRVNDVDAGDPSFIRHAAGMLANTVEKLAVRRMIVVCDSTEPSFRCDEYAGYKADRKPHPPVLAAQAPKFFDALRDVSVAVVQEPRYEADDLITTLTSIGKCVIVSSDKDMLAQLDDGQVLVYDPMKDKYVDRAAVKEKFGVDPSQLFDYTGLVGDTSDGIPGVPGFGPKTAAKLLREFDSLDEIYSPPRAEALAEVCSKKQLAALYAHKDDAFMSRRLACPWICKQLLRQMPIDCDAPSPAIIRGSC